MAYAHPPEVRALVLQMAREGANGAQIAERTGICVHTVGSWLRAAGLSLGRGHNRAPSAVRERAVQLRAAGASLPRIAAEVGMSEATVWRWIAPPRSTRSAPPPPPTPPPSTEAARALAERRRQLRVELASMGGVPPCRCGLRGEHVCLPESASQLPVTGDGGGWLVEGCSRRGVGHR